MSLTQDACRINHSNGHTVIPDKSNKTKYPPPTRATTATTSTTTKMSLNINYSKQRFY